MPDMIHSRLHTNRHTASPHHDGKEGGFMKEDAMREQQGQEGGERCVDERGMQRGLGLGGGG